MLSIYSYAAKTWGNASSLADVTATKAAKNSETGATGSGDVSSVSTLARQLSEAAERAAARDAGKTREQLAALEKSLTNEFLGSDCRLFTGYRADPEAETPKSDDPELLARAKQATDCISGKRGKNPFEGLSRKQLSLIMYDHGDAFTINERRAAFLEHSRQYQIWDLTVCAQAQIEQRQTNTFTRFYKACIAEYMEASPIEQATYHPEYVSRMEYYIELWESGRAVNFSPPGHETLVELLLPDFKEYDRNLSWGLVSKLPMPEAWESAGTPKAETPE
jgi:hypothetical protein